MNHPPLTMTTPSTQSISHAARWRQKLVRLAVMWCVSLVAAVWTWHVLSWPYALIPLALALVLRVLLPSARRDQQADSVTGKILWFGAIFLVIWSPPVREMMKGLGDRLWTLDSLQLTIGLSCLCMVHVLRYCEWLRGAPLSGLLAYYDGTDESDDTPPKA